MEDVKKVGDLVLIMVELYYSFFLLRNKCIIQNDFYQEKQTDLWHENILYPSFACNCSIQGLIYNHFK